MLLLIMLSGTAIILAVYMSSEQATVLTGLLVAAVVRLRRGRKPVRE
jgi:hypothetical protein